MSDMPREPITDRLEPVDLQDEIQKSYLDYAMSVIVGRALPDIRDGLKPCIAESSTGCMTAATGRIGDGTSALGSSARSWVNITRTVILRFTTRWFGSRSRG